MSRRHLWPSSFASGTKYQYCGGIRKACCCYWPVCSLRPVPNAAGEWSPAKSQQFQLQGTWKAVFHWMLAVGANLSTCKDLQQSCNHMQVDSDVEDLRWLESSGLVKVSFTQRLSRICSDPRLRVTSQPRIAGAQDSLQSTEEWRQGLERLACRCSRCSRCPNPSFQYPNRIVVAKDGTSGEKILLVQRSMPFSQH